MNRAEHYSEIVIPSGEIFLLQGTNLLQAVTHEVGHSLGLQHSERNESMMAPFYRSGVRRYKTQTIKT